MKPPNDRGPGNRSAGGPRKGSPPDRQRHGGPRPDGGRPEGKRPEGGRSEGGRGGKSFAGGEGTSRPAAEPRREERLHLPARPAPEPRPEGQRPQGYRPAGHRQHGQHGQQERRTPEAPRGTLWLYGLHAVTAALANPARRLRRLLLTAEAEAQILTTLPQPWPVQPERADRGQIDHMLGRDAVHQGAALLADPLTPPSLAQALERPGPVLVLDQVSDPRNVGAILRTAAAFGVAAVITQDRNAPEETGALAKAASGALEKVPLFRAVNISRTIVALKAAGVWCVGLDAGGAVLSGVGFAGRRVALVLGAEGEGLRRLTRETCDEVAGIAMPIDNPTAMESLNVATAAAIALYEIRRGG
jgi:23S rRNA (guanosine2251-2'-O)-methyltransferase